MHVSPSLSRKLRETLGQDAGGDLVTWLEDQRSETAQLRADLAELEAVMNQRFDRLEARFAQFETRFEARLDSRLSDVKSDLMKWSFLFWCAAVAAIAALAGVLR